jgi:hypothetical protein
MPAVLRHFEACFAARWSQAVLSRLRMLVPLMHGSRTRAPHAKWMAVHLDPSLASGLNRVALAA